MPEAPLRVAVVGLGIGLQHLASYRELSERFEVVALCDLNKDKAEEVAARFGKVAPYTSLEALLAREQLDIVDLCTPPFLHFEQIKTVLAHGLHVICEKPLVGSLAEVEALGQAEKASQGLILPIFQYRFGRGLQKLKHLKDAGITGRAFVTTVETSWRRRAEYYAVPWRGKWASELGGALISHALHAHDALSYIMGDVTKVAAFTSTRVNPIEVEDCASVSLGFADGSLASLTVTLGSAAEISRHRFCFENLVAESNLEPYRNSGEPWTFTPDTPEQGARIAAALEAFEPLPEGYTGQFYRIYDALRTGSEPPVTLTDARRSLELATAIYKSSETRELVTLPLAKDDPYYRSWRPKAYRTS